MSDETVQKRKGIGSFRELGLVVFIVLLCVIVQGLNSSFMSAQNIYNLLTDTAIIVILSIGMMVVILTGGIDLSIGATIALTGMVVALHVKAVPDLSPVLAVLEGIAAGTVCGAVVGVLIAWVNVLPIIASLGMCYVYRGAVFLISGGKWVSAQQMGAPFKAMATGNVLGVNNLVIIAFAVFLISVYFLGHTKTGRRFYAVGSNAEAARISGINAGVTKWLAYTIMGALAGLAGVLWVSKFASAQPDTATGYEVNIIAACVIGGISISGGSGKPIGALLGALLIGIINDALPLIRISEFSKNFIQGIIILGAVVLNTLVKRRAEWQTLVRRKL